jgi:hypothetical protein
MAKNKKIKSASQGPSVAQQLADLRDAQSEAQRSSDARFQVLDSKYHDLEELVISLFFSLPPSRVSDVLIGDGHGPRRE